MKKNNFLEGSFIATTGIILCKIIGLLYVIPFYAMLTKTGSALYSYAYSIYAVFLSLSTSGIPIAMSKLVSEYNSLEYNYTKEKIYKIGTRIIMGLGIFFFIILFITAPLLAKLILGTTTGGNTISDVTFVIRIISTALLIVPLLSVTKGYLQGHKFITPPSISNVIEQLIRVFIIIFGCYFSLRIMHFDEKIAIAISVFAATIGALVAYLYLLYKTHKYKNDLNRTALITREEHKFTTKMLVKQILYCALPFIIIDILKSSYSMVDTLTVVRTLTKLGYSSMTAETTFSVIATWGSKLTMIVIAISMGISTSLIPSIAVDNVTHNNEHRNKKINQALESLLYITIPMTLGLSLLGGPIWVMFYGYDSLSIEIFELFIWTAVTFSLFSVLINIVQTMNHTKVAVGVLFISFLANALLNIPMIRLCHALSNNGYQGATISTLITQLIPSLFLIYYLKKKHNLHLKESFNNITKILLSSLIMYIVLKILNLFIHINVQTRTEAIYITALYGIIGVLIYLATTYKSGVITSLFEEKLKRKVIKR